MTCPDMDHTNLQPCLPICIPPVSSLCVWFLIKIILQLDKFHQWDNRSVGSLKGKQRGLCGDCGEGLSQIQMNAHPIPLEPMCVHPMRWMIFSTPVIGLRQMTSIPPMNRLANASALVTIKALCRIFFIAITPFVAVFVFMLYCPYITNITHEINFCQYIYVFVCK